MRNITIMITFLLLVGCNKEKRALYGKWICYETYTRYGYLNSNSNSWVLYTEDDFEVKITKDHWHGLIEGKCYLIEANEITLDKPDGNLYTYTYSPHFDEIRFNKWVDKKWVLKSILKRK